MKIVNFIWSKLFTLFETDDAIMDKDFAKKIRVEGADQNYRKAVDKLRKHKDKTAKVAIDDQETVEITLG